MVSAAADDQEGVGVGVVGPVVPITVQEGVIVAMGMLLGVDGRPWP